ncbi:hypothetical protein LPJ73_005407 [Coemansia sp. RSA 2703]|nr:hypothetical protein LPJ73_005407 [Coemansia sp. RSA 2703]KAJ2375223.1 hypothetical protein IW150_002673 [Coemansia sp. RSA 2607]
MQPPTVHPNDARLLDPTPLDDGLDAALHAHVASAARPRRAAPTVSDFSPPAEHAYETLNQYCASGQWRQLALASAASILATAQDDYRAALQRWTYRALALTRLGHAAQAETELTRLASAVALRRWPLALRLLRALAPSDKRISLDRLAAIRRALVRKGDKAAYGVGCVTLLEAHCALRLRDAPLVFECLERVRFPGTEGQDPNVLSFTGRMHLQFGDIVKAEKLFEEAERCAAPGDQIVLMNRALLAVAGGRWDVAREQFAQVAGLSAAANRAVCELYLGDPQGMLDEMLKLMVEMPAVAGTAEPLVFNYCAALELHYDGRRLAEAKAKKLVDVATWAPDAFDVAALKLQQ